MTAVPPISDYEGALTTLVERVLSVAIAPVTGLVTLVVVGSCLLLLWLSLRRAWDLNDRLLSRIEVLEDRLSARVIRTE